MARLRIDTKNNSIIVDISDVRVVHRQGKMVRIVYKDESYNQLNFDTTEEANSIFEKIDKGLLESKQPTL